MSSGLWRKGCRARCAHTGRSCALLAGHVGAHAHGRIQFTAVATPGQTHFAGDELLVSHAHGRREDADG